MPTAFFFARTLHSLHKFALLIYEKLAYRERYFPGTINRANFRSLETNDQQSRLNVAFHFVQAQPRLCLAEWIGDRRSIRFFIFFIKFLLLYSFTQFGIREYRVEKFCIAWGRAGVTNI